MKRSLTYTALALLTIAALSTNAHACPKGSRCGGIVTEPPAPVVNVNTANEAEFMRLPGIGPVLASSLNDLCEANDHRDGATFKTVDDLLRVKGIGPKLLAKIRPYIVLTGATTAKGKIHVAKGATRVK